MKNKLKMKNKLQRLIEQEIRNQLSEGSLTNDLSTTLNDLIENIKSGVGVDKRSKDKYNDGELLSMFLRPLFQSAILNMDSDSIKSFRKNFKF